MRPSHRIILALLACAAIAAVAAGPIVNDAQRPTITSFTASPATIPPGDFSTLAWSVDNADAVTINGQAELNADGSPALASSVSVSPTSSSTYTLVASRGRHCACQRCLQGSSVQSQITVTVATPNPNPAPTPPYFDVGLSAVGIGEAFTLSATLSAAARSHDLAGFLAAQNGTWLEICPEAMAVQHPAALDGWMAAWNKSGKAEPGIIWYSTAGGTTSILGIDAVASSATAADLLALAKSHLPTPIARVKIKGKWHGLGYKTAIGDRANSSVIGDRAHNAAAGRDQRSRLYPQIKSVQQILTPLTPDQYPQNVDLRTQFQYVKDQGQEGTCYAQAPTSLFEAASYVAYGPKNSTEFSPNFLAAITDGLNGGMAGDVLQALMSTGVVPMSAQPDYVHQPPAGYQQLAANYQALAVYGPPVGVPASAGRPPKGGAPADSTGYVAAAIARGYPVTVGISVGNGFNPDADGYITYAQGAGSQVNHEIVICGGWVQHNGQNFVRMKNSWGADWGTFGDGTCFIEDKFLGDDTDLWVIVVTSAAPSYQFDAPPTPAKR